MSVLPAWSEVVAAALVGTDRSGPRDLGLSTVEDPSAALLDAAAVVTVHRRAGRRPVTGIELPAPAPDDAAPVVGPGPTAVVAGPVPAAPVVGPAAANRLARLLDQGGAVGDGLDAELRSELLTEWLTVAARAGRRVPGEFLPALLDAGRRRRDLCPLIVAAGGARAGWLAAQRSEWAYLTVERDDSAASDPTLWETGSPGQRAGHLAAARRADPDAARELLAAGWGAELPDHRAALLATLATGLSTADEEFLERALDDRRKDVRSAAAELLARLPGSAYQDRMTARIRDCVRREPGTDRLVVIPPARCDKPMQRDGVAAKPPSGMGERAWWLEELLARTPLETWSAEPFPASPAGFLALRVPDGWTGTLLRGLARATTASGDPRWAGPLVDALYAQAAPRERPDDLQLVEALYARLPEPELVARTIAELGRNPARSPGLDRLLELCPRPWPAPLAEAALAALGQLLRRSVPSWRLTELFRLTAVRVPVDVAPNVAALARSVHERPVDDHVPGAVDMLADIVRFRHDMHEELAS